MLKNIWKTTALLALLVLVLGACQSTIRIQVDRTPTLNTAGIRRIAIMPFEGTGSSTHREIAQHITTVATRNITALNHFTLVAPSSIEQLQRNNESIEGHVDALFTGQVLRIGSRDSSSVHQRRNSDGDTVSYTVYRREVDIEFSYYFIRARDGSIIGPVIKRRSASNTNEDFGSLRSTTDLLRSIVDSQLRLIGRDVAPYTVTENRRLMGETSKDKDIKARMKNAESQVKSGSYRLALESYIGIYEASKSIAAAVNASILHEALGEGQAALNLLQTVFAETGNPRARDELARLNRVLEDQLTIASEYDDARTLSERVAAFATGEIQRVLSRDARVWIYNNTNDNIIAEAVVDNITADLIRRGVGLVDRENMTLIEAEQNFHMSGNVSDNDFLSIGNAAGANTIVIVGITGTGDMRRLQIRVLDIERGVPILQSDTSDSWKL